ncbi:Cof-type HAD-IIB family hydrolase [Jeotgalibacillus marinus]|uniref:Cof-type HAD-IIB family hydrolase n=1 Tax=Jeotgalibacillus marinus TaxID=86667 RepID=A0ABV3Q6K5_9BACL
MKVVAIDLDGTLLSEDLTIHEENVRAIREAQQQGSIISIATGRALFDAQNIIEKYGLNCPIIASNGAQIYVDNKKIDEQFMDPHITQPIIQWLNEENTYYQPYLSDKIVVSDRGIHHLEEELHEVVKQDPSFNKDHFWESIKVTIEQNGLQEVRGTIHPTDYDSIVKLMVVSPDTSKLKRAKEYFNQLGGCVVSSSGEFNLEIMSVGVDKGIGLHKLCDYYGTTVKNTVVIGDNLNDMPMFHVAGMGIAMGNAEEELIKIATFKTLSNNECGVAYAFNKYIQENEMVSSGLTGR